MTATAEKAVEACLEQIRRARLAGGAADGDRATAKADERRAEEERAIAAEAKVLGEEGPADKYREANERLRDARERIEQAEVEQQAAARALRSAEARLAQTRETHYEELAEAVEEGPVAALLAAADDLVLPLSRYLAAYNDAARAWTALGPASQARVRELDELAGRYRDVSHIWTDAGVPDCPLPADAIARIRSILPRPRFRNSGYRPAAVPGDVEVTDAKVRP